MAGQYIQHSTYSTSAHSDVHEDKHRRQICRDVHTHTKLRVAMIDRDKKFLWGTTDQTSYSHTHTHTHSETDEQSNHTGHQDKLCIKGGFQEIKDPVTIKDQNGKNKNVQSPP